MERRGHQLKLPLPFSDKPDLGRVTNVASVPQRSPFRYPGGKTWLIPYVRLWFASLPTQPAEYIELFAGGGSIGLTVAFERLAQHVTLVEIDDQVSAVWQTILGRDGQWLADQIRDFDLTPENVEQVLSQATTTLREKAFQTLLKNRVNRGGILAPGAGRIKRGENGKGITSRWYPETLRKRILAIAAVRDEMTFIEGDGLGVLAQNVHRPDAVFFIDPPYSAAGKKAGMRLYTHFAVDHEALFDSASKIAADFLMTYDDSEEIRQLARRHGLDTQTVAMKNTHHAKMAELLIGRNLDWIRRG
jgi:DNA adenine methylase